MKKRDELRQYLLSFRKIAPSGCWEWTRRRDRDGYGRYSGMLVHRLAAHLFWGFNLKRKIFVLHRCDNPPCFNPNHLFLGTNSDNMKDCLKKNGKPADTKLSPKDVKKIRGLLKRMTAKDVAKLYGMSRTHIYRINNREAWWYV